MLWVEEEVVLKEEGDKPYFGCCEQRRSHKRLENASYLTGAPYKLVAVVC